MTARPAILAIETSTEHCSVALLSGRGMLLRELNAGPRSSSEVLPMAQSLLAEAGMKLADCQAIAFGEGPGAFTGLRIACGMAQGLAYGAGLPVLAVDSLEACALACAQTAEQRSETLLQDVLVAVDARMDECYWALYRLQDGVWRRQGDTRVSPPEAVDPRPLAQTFAVAGNAPVVYGDRLAAAQPSAGASSLYPGAMPRADRVAEIALRHVAEGRLLRPEDAVPVYVRNKVALTTTERAQRKAAEAQ